MINAIVGRPGGGKSYEAVRYHILPAILKDKRQVVTNIPLQLDYIAKIYGEDSADLVTVIEGEFQEYGTIRPFSKPEHFTQNDWKNEKGQGCLFVVDEAHLSVGREANKQVLEYLSMHRHYGVDILVLTQNARKLHRDLKDMVEVTHRCSKMQVYGEDGYVRKTYHGIDSSSDAAQIEERTYDQEYFAYYKSHTQANSAVQEAAIKDANVELNPMKKYLKFLVPIGLGIIILPWIFKSDETEQNATEATKTDQVIEQTLQNTSPGNLESAIVKPPTKAERAKTRNQEIEEQIKRRSEQYHPFHKVNLHIAGSYQDASINQVEKFFSASQNGQKVFDLSLKDFTMAGYTVRILGDCVVEITFYEFKEYLTCDVPSISVDPGVQFASN